MSPRISTRWGRIKQLLFGTSGLLAVSLSVTTGIGALLRELVVLDERQQINTKAREKLTFDLVAVATDVATLDKLVTFHLHDDEAKTVQFEALRQRVDNLEKEGTSKRIDDLRSDFGDARAAVDFLRSRVDTITDRTQNNIAHPEINIQAPSRR